MRNTPPSLIAFALSCALAAGCAPVRYYQALSGKQVPQREPPPIVEQGQSAPAHQTVTTYGDGLRLARIRKHDEQAFGIVDGNNRVVIPIGYQHIIDRGADGFAAIGLQSLRSFDRQGRQTATTLFERELNFVNGQAVAIIKPPGGDADAERYGVIDTDGKTVIPFDYRRIFERHTQSRPTVSWYLVERDVSTAGEPKRYRTGLLDARGRTVLPIEYFDISPNVDVEGLDEGWAMLFEREHGSVAVNFLTGVRMPRAGGSFYGRTVGYSTLLNPEPETLNQYEKMQYRKANPARYRLELFDTQGRLVYDQRDIEVTWDLKGLIAVSRAGKFALLDAQGRPLSEFVYDAVKDFGGGQALMERDGDKVCIDAADPAGTQRAARQCRKATTLKNKNDHERAPSGFPAVYPRYGG